MRSHRRRIRRRHRNKARQQSRSVLRTAKRTVQLGIGYLGCFFLPERGFAAIHVHHAAHAAFALAEVQRHAGERAAGQDEQQEKRCKALLHAMGPLYLKVLIRVNLSIPVPWKVAFSEDLLGNTRAA